MSNSKACICYDIILEYLIDNDRYNEAASDALATLCLLAENWEVPKPPKSCPCPSHHHTCTCEGTDLIERERRHAKIEALTEVLKAFNVEYQPFRGLRDCVRHVEDKIKALEATK